MKNKYFFVFLLFITIALSGCTVMLTSNKSADFHKKAKSIYVLFKGEETRGEYYNLLSKYLKKLFAEKSIACDYYIIEPRSTETDEEIFQKVCDTNTDIFLLIEPVQEGSYNDNGATFDLEIFHENSKNIVWTGRLDGGVASDINTLAMLSAKQLVIKLMADNMLDIQLFQK